MTCEPELARLRTRITPEVLAAEWTLGQSMSIEASIALDLRVLRKRAM